MSTSPKGNSNENKLQPKRSRGKFIRERKPPEEGCDKASVCRISTREIFVSNLFLLKNKDGGNRSVINLKKLNQFIPYNHFNIECLQSVKDVLKKDSFMCKLDLRDAYFSIPLSEDTERYVRFFGETTCTNFSAFVLAFDHLHTYLPNF